MGKKTVRARAKSGLAGAPLDGTFYQFKQYMHIEIDAKGYVDIVKNYIKKEFSKSDALAINANPKYEFTGSHIASIIYWNELDNPLPEQYAHGKEWVINKLQSLIEPGKKITKAC